MQASFFLERVSRDAFKFQSKNRGIKKPPKRSMSPSKGRADVKGKTMSKDTSIFDRIKAKLLTPTSDEYTDFLKVLHLFTQVQPRALLSPLLFFQEVITKQDLVSLVEDLLEPHKGVLEEFKQWLGVKGLRAPLFLFSIILFSPFTSDFFCLLS